MKITKLAISGFFIPILALLAMLLQSAPIAAEGAGADSEEQTVGVQTGINLVILPASQTVSQGSVFDVVVQAQCGALSTNGIDAFVNYDPAVLAVQSAVAGTALNTVLTEPTFDNSAGTFDFGAGKLSGTLPTGNFTVVTITFLAKSVTPTPAAIIFGSAFPRQTQVQLNGNDVTGALTCGFVTIISDVPLYLDPPSVLSVGSHQVFNLDIKTNLSANQNVTGVQAYINFDPAKLEVVDADDATSGIQITPGSSLSTVLENSADNTGGLIGYSAGQLTGAFPAGSFVVATIQFRARTVSADGTTPVSISLTGTSTTSMVDFGGTAVPGAHGNAEVHLVVGANVDISVTLQGGNRPDAGWMVPLTIKFFTPGVSAPTDVLTAAPVYNIPLTTAKNGSQAVVTATGITPGIYDISVVSPHCLLNVKRGVTIATPSTSVNLGSLLEGNANDDNIVNIQDFGILAAAYGKVSGAAGYDARADFDRTGNVSIADFGLLATNYNKYSPQTVVTP